MSQSPDQAMAELVAAARTARTHAYAPYSRFAVGAALRLTDGTLITGSNLENASYGLSLCAEAAAIAAANSAGRLGDIEAIAVVGGAMDGNAGAAPASPATPCGRCRQMLAEVEGVSGRAIKVTCAGVEGEAMAHYSVEQLLPHSFGQRALNRGDE